ncbi:phytoene desaturase family protein [Chloroflexota bacterium]
MAKAGSDYDVVVIGSGIGGLSAGALLAHAGYKTLVLEKDDYVGGRWSTEELEGFKLERGAHVIECGGTLEQTFIDVGAKWEHTAAPRLWWKVDGVDYEMPPKGTVRRLLEIVSELDAKSAKAEGRIASAVPISDITGGLRRGFDNPEAEVGPSFRDWVMQYTDSKRVHDIFDSIAIVAGARACEMPTAAMFRFFRIGGARLSGKATRGDSVNAESLAGVVKANGDVWTGCRVKQILVKDKTAQGVVVQKDGAEETIASRVVISNVGPKATVQLVGEDVLDDIEYMKLLRMRVRPTPAVQIYLASDEPLWGEPGVKGVCQVMGARRIIGIVPFSSICPDLAPPGQHLTFIFGGPQNSLFPMDIECETKQYMADLDDLLPDWRKRGRILKFDARNVDDEFPEYRSWPGHGIAPETPIRNLYNCGDAIIATKEGGQTIDTGYVGTAGAGESGRVIADMVKKTLPL